MPLSHLVPLWLIGDKEAGISHTKELGEIVIDYRLALRFVEGIGSENSQEIFDSRSEIGCGLLTIFVDEAKWMRNGKGGSGK